MGNLYTKVSKHVYVKQPEKLNYEPVQKVTLTLEEMLHLTSMLRHASISESEYQACLANGQIPLAGTLRAKGKAKRNNNHEMDESLNESTTPIRLLDTLNLLDSGEFKLERNWSMNENLDEEDKQQAEEIDLVYQDTMSPTVIKVKKPLMQHENTSEISLQKIETRIESQISSNLGVDTSRVPDIIKEEVSCFSPKRRQSGDIPQVPREEEIYHQSSPNLTNQSFYSSDEEPPRNVSQHRRSISPLPLYMSDN